MPIDEITYTFHIDKVEIEDEPYVYPFKSWVEDRQEQVWGAIKRSKDYPKKLIDEWNLLEMMKEELDD